MQNWNGVSGMYDVQWFLNGDSLDRDEYYLDSLGAGIYSYYFEDGAHCVATGTVEIKSSTPPELHEYVADTVVCWGESIQVWYTPGFNMYGYDDYYMGTSADTFYMGNGFGSGAPYIGRDSAGCEAYITDYPDIYMGGYPQSFYMHVKGDTVYLGNSLNTSSGFASQYDWSTPHGYFTSSYSFLVIDTSGSYSCMQMDEHGCSIGTGSIFVTFTGIDEITTAEAKVILLPNPSSSDVTIRIRDEYVGSELVVFDISGRRVLETTVSTTQFKLNTSNYSAGTYFVKVGNSVSRLVKD